MNALTRIFSKYFSKSDAIKVNELVGNSGGGGGGQEIKVHTIIPYNSNTKIITIDGVAYNGFDSVPQDVFITVIKSAIDGTLRYVNASPTATTKYYLPCCYYVKASYGCTIQIVLTYNNNYSYSFDTYDLLGKTISEQLLNQWIEALPEPYKTLFIQRT